MAEAAFVTGGSGFIGGRLVERLVDEGRPVRALARSEAAAERVAGLGAEPMRGDIGDRGSLSAAAARSSSASSSPSCCEPRESSLPGAASPLGRPRRWPASPRPPGRPYR